MELQPNLVKWVSVLLPVLWESLIACSTSSQVHACVLSRFSHVQLFATLWTVAHQSPLSTGFFRQEYWSGLPCSPCRDLPDPGIEPMSLMSPVLAGGFFTISTTWEAPSQVEMSFILWGLMKKEFPFDFLFKHLYSLYNNKINGDSQNIFQKFFTVGQFIYIIITFLEVPFAI